mgnify:FL=1
MNKASIFKHFISIGTGTVINMLVGFLTTPILTRLVGTAEYGQYSIFTMYASIALMILCMGFDQALIRYFYCFDTQDYQRTIVRECCVLPFVSTLLVGIFVNVVSLTGLIRFEFQPEIMTMLTISVFFQVINRIDLILLRVTYQTKLYSMLQVMTKVLFAVIAIVGCFLLQTQKLFVLTVACAVSYGVVTVVGIGSQKELWNFKKIRQRYSIDRKELYHYAFPFIVSMGITTIFQAIDKISLNCYCSYEKVGIYSSAITLVHVFAIVQTTFGAIWSPMVVEHYEKESEDRSFYQKGFRTMSFVMFFIGISLILCKDLFVMLLGEDYRGSAAMIPFLCLSPIMLTISDTTVIGITFSKKSYLQIVVSVVACATNIAGNTLLVPIMGGVGAAISTGLSYIVFFAMRTFLSNRYFPMKWGIGKFSIITLMFLAYAWYNTFHSFGVITILGYVVILAMIVFNYQDVIREGYHLMKKQFS